MEMARDIEKLVAELIDEKRQICLFGTGRVGTILGYKYVNLLKTKGLGISYFCDNDSSKWGKKIVDNIICISPDELIKLENPFVIIMITQKKSDSVIKWLDYYGIDFITYSELVNSDYMVDLFLRQTKNVYNETERKWVSEYEVLNICNPQNKEVAIYTCICGDYDEILEPLYLDCDCDYYLITDKRPTEETYWNYLSIDSILTDKSLDNYRKNRFCKIHGCEIFANYDYSIYIDGNMLLKGDLKQYIKKIGKSGIGLFKMPKEGGDCLFVHGTYIAGIRSSENEVRKQLNAYMIEGMPRHYGAFECSFIVRDNHNTLTKKIMRDWWKEVYEKSYRDQISFMYVIWKNGLTAKDIGCLGENVRNISEITRYAHEINAIT